MGVGYVMNVGLGLIGLQMVNVPMFFCLRRLVAPIVLLYEYATMGKVADPGVRVAVAIIVAGAVLAGWDTLSADLVGYVITMLNNVVSAASSVLVRRRQGGQRGGGRCSPPAVGRVPAVATRAAPRRRRLDARWVAMSIPTNGRGAAHAAPRYPPPPLPQQKQFSERTKMSAFGIVYVSAIIATPLTAVLAVVTGEIDKVAAFPHLADPRFVFGFFVSCGMGLVLSYSSMLSTTYNSPLATSVTGNAKDIATTTIGWLAFPGFKPTVNSVGGIGLSFVGAFVYSYVNLKKQLAGQPPRARKVTDDAAPPTNGGGSAGSAAAVEDDGGDMQLAGRGGAAALRLDGGSALSKALDAVDAEMATPMGSTVFGHANGALGSGRVNGSAANLTAGVRSRERDAGSPLSRDSGSAAGFGGVGGAGGIAHETASLLRPTAGGGGGIS
jgi:drug/metabolite transporter (DMT)-like permease